MEASQLSAAQERRVSPERVKAFGDGVFAIIITILVLEIGVPANLSEQSLLRDALDDLGSDLIAWVVSFLITGMYWAWHRDLFNQVRYVDTTAVWLNLLFLLPAALIPADTVQAAADSVSADDLFVRLEDAGVVLRTDPSVTPTMAKTPTLARWELDRLRTVENVARHGHLRRVEPGRLTFEDDSTARVGTDAVVVHAAAPGLPRRPPVPIWRPEGITLQPIRAGRRSPPTPRSRRGPTPCHSTPLASPQEQPGPPSSPMPSNGSTVASSQGWPV